MKYRYTTSYSGNLVRTARIYAGDEHSLTKTLIRREALQVIKRLISHGYEAYIVGGSIRDILLGIKPKDFDVVTNASPRKIRSLFPKAYVIGRRFLLVHVLINTIRVEVATFRSLTSQTDEQQWGSIDEDVLRRDFSVNALYYSPNENIILDFVDAMDDITSKVLRPIIPLQTIFVEDPVRLIRAVKYSKGSQLEYTKKLRKKMVQSAHLLKNVSETRLTEEFLKILASPVFAQIFVELYETGMLSYILPNIDRYLRKKPFFYTQWVNDLKECEYSLPALGELVDESDESAHGTKMKRIRYGQIIFVLCRQSLLEMPRGAKKDRRPLLKVAIKKLLEPLLPPNQFIVSAAQEFIREEL